MPWIQYILTDGAQISGTGNKVDDAVIADAGKGQFFYDGDPADSIVDITQHPPVVIPARE